MTWNYNAKQYDPSKVGGFELIPEGDHRARIKSAVEAKTKREPIRDMIVLELEISGYSRALRYYLVLDGTSEDAVQRTNQSLGTMFAAFAIQPGNFNLQSYAGKVGGVHISHEPYTGNDGKERTSAKVAWLLLPDQCSDLPPWGTKAAISPIPGVQAVRAEDYFGQLRAQREQEASQLDKTTDWTEAADGGDLPWN